MVPDDRPGPTGLTMRLHLTGDLSADAVAETVGCPLQTAYSRLHAARDIVTRAPSAYASTAT